MTVARTKPRPRPNLGAVKCWCSHGVGWSYVQQVGERIVTVLDTWAGGRPVERAIPPDKVLARMTPAEVRTARKTGRLHETGDGTGFTLSQAP